MASSGSSANQVILSTTDFPNLSPLTQESTLLQPSHPLRVILGIMSTPYELTMSQDQRVRNNLQRFREQAARHPANRPPMAFGGVPAAIHVASETLTRLDRLEARQTRLINELLITTTDIKITRIEYLVLNALELDSPEATDLALAAIRDYLGDM